MVKSAREARWQESQILERELASTREWRSELGERTRKRAMKNGGVSEGCPSAVQEQELVCMLAVSLTK